MGRLDGKVAFITGAGAGIARASAIAFAREGARVAIVERNAATGAATEQAIKAAGGDALFIETDVTQQDSVANAVETTVEQYGALDVLFNCAGGSMRDDGPVHLLDMEIWRQTIDLNLLNPFLCCRYALPHMIAAKRGSIINMCSWAGLVGTSKPVYAATKGGLVAFTKSLAWHYADHNIRANAIAPAVVRTERNIARYGNGDDAEVDIASLSAGARENLATLRTYPLSAVQPEDTAAVALFLASDESRSLTGTTIAADGGRSSYLKLLAD